MSVIVNLVIVVCSVVTIFDAGNQLALDRREIEDHRDMLDYLSRREDWLNSNT